jgi:hypothetical protein
VTKCTPLRTMAHTTSQMAHRKTSSRTAALCPSLRRPRSLRWPRPSSTCSPPPPSLAHPPRPLPVAVNCLRRAKPVAVNCLSRAKLAAATRTVRPNRANTRRALATPDTRRTSKFLPTPLSITHILISCSKTNIFFTRPFAGRSPIRPRLLRRLRPRRRRPRLLHRLIARLLCHTLATTWTNPCTAPGASTAVRLTNAAPFKVAHWHACIERHISSLTLDDSLRFFKVATLFS